MALSLWRIGQLKSLAERDARKCLQMLLDRKKNRLPLTEESIRDFQTRSLMAFLNEEHIADVVDVGSVATFYAAEFRRQLDALWDVLTAASGVNA